MLRKKTCCLVPILMILGFSIALPQQMPDPIDSYLDEFSPFATVGQVFFGPLGNGSFAVTSLQVTNRALQSCDIGILIHKGVFIPDDFPVLINGEPGPFAAAAIPSGGVRSFDVTSNVFVQGAGALGFRTLAPGCDANSFRVMATSFVVDPEELDIAEVGAPAPMQVSQGRTGTTGRLAEAFSIGAHDSDSWLCPGFCLAISTTEGVGTAGIRQRLGIATSSVIPGQEAPEGTLLRFLIYDFDGAFVGSRDIEVDGSHTAFFPGMRVSEFAGRGTMIFCLESSNTEYKLDLTVIRVNQLADGTFQYDQAIFTDGFESGDTTAWVVDGD